MGAHELGLDFFRAMVECFWSTTDLRTLASWPDTVDFEAMYCCGGEL
jgi:hypothetical protein